MTLTHFSLFIVCLFLVFIVSFNVLWKTCAKFLSTAFSNTKVWIFFTPYVYRFSLCCSVRNVFHSACMCFTLLLFNHIGHSFFFLLAIADAVIVSINLFRFQTFLSHSFVPLCPQTIIVRSYIHTPTQRDWARRIHCVSSRAFSFLSQQNLCLDL